MIDGQAWDVAEFAPEHLDGLPVGQILEHLFYMPQIACNLQFGIAIAIAIGIALAAASRSIGGANGRVEVILKHAGKDATTKSTRPLC